MKAGWQTRKLGELCAIELGKTPARANKSLWDECRETGNVWLSIADLLQAEDKIVVDSKEYVSNKGAAICKIVLKGTLLVSFKLTLGRLAFAGRDLYTNEAIAALSIFNEQELSKEFLYYFFHYFDWAKAAENDVKLKGMTLNKAKLKEIDVRYPPPAEQQRIVAILDEAFAGIATATANAEKNLQNARELFESTLRSVFAEKGEGWVETNLGSLADFKNGLNFSKRSRGETIKIVGVKDFQSNYWVPMDELADVQIDGELPDTYVLHKGDILTVRSNGNKNLIGRCILAGDVPEITSHSGFTIRIRVKSEDVAPDYLVHYLKSETVRQLLIDSGGGANISSLNQTALTNLPVLLPSREEQATIVSRIVKLEQEKDRLVSVYQSKLDALNELKQSILQKAFAGELH